MRPKLNNFHTYCRQNSRSYVIFTGSMDDKRKFRRFQINMPSELTREDSTLAHVPVIVINVSFGGLGLISPEDLPVGTLITLRWDRPPFTSAPNPTIKGRIAGSRRKPTQPGKYEVNVAYLDHDPALAQQLLRWAQMQSLLEAKARTRPGGLPKARGSSFY